jgi:hypothetical protein
LRLLHWHWRFTANAVLNNYSNLHNDSYEGINMVRLIQILVLAETIIRAMLKRLGILLLLLAPILTGCGGDVAARREREHVNAMQRQVTEASKGLVTADAEARRGWVEAQKSFEQTRSSIVRQQADIQSGLDRLETERKAIVAQRAMDGLVSESIEAIGIVLAVLVPLLLLGWLMHRFWQTDSVPDVEAMIVQSMESTPVIRLTHERRTVSDSQFLLEQAGDDS